MAETQTDSIEVTWDKLAKEFRNWNGMRPKWSWLRNGLSERAEHNRVRLLEGSSQAKAYFSLTKDLTGSELKYLHARATVNLEQAQIAARLATLLNLTVFIGGVMIINQLFPGLLAKQAQAILQGDDHALILVFFVTIVLFVMSVIRVLCFSYGGVGQARDLKHLLDLSLARRSLRQTQDGIIDNGSIMSDLRDNFISDV